jgi:hypothetical protein
VRNIVSERANLTVPVENACNDGRGHRFARAMGGVTLATGILAGAAMGIGEVAYDDPMFIPNNIGYNLGAALSSCDPMPAGDVQKMADKLKADMDAAKPTDPRVHYDVFSDTSIPATAKKYGLSLPDNAKGVYEDITSITQPEYGWMAASVLNSYTKREYGFTVDSGDFGRTTKTDAANIVAELYPIPKEIVKAVVKNDLSKVHLDAPTEDMEYYKAQGDKAAGDYKPMNGSIDLGSTYAGALPHEIGHALRKTASHEDCTLATVGDIPDFSNANPRGFVYGHDNKGWEKVTLDQYAAQGAPDATEDYATTAGKVLRPHRSELKDCAYGQSETINRKEAVVLAAVQRAVPHGGEYLSEQFAAQAKC